MNKPTITREVAIEYYFQTLKIIMFYSTADAISEFYEFGLVEQLDHKPNYYRLFVDSRFDFLEVVKYIEGYG